MQTLKKVHLTELYFKLQDYYDDRRETAETGDEEHLDEEIDEAFKTILYELEYDMQHRD